MLFKFFPQEFNFFDLFELQADCAVKAARYLKEVVASGTINEDMLSKIQKIEHEGDDATHTIISQLNKTFITPFDREDIHTLTKQIDDIVDMIDTIIGRMHVYNIQGVDKHLVAFAAVIEDSVCAVAAAVKGLRNIKNPQSVSEACVEINRLENVGDTMRDKVIMELFETKKDDPLAVIKWKEIYEHAETVLDVCEDVAHVVESIMVKQA